MIRKQLGEIVLVALIQWVIGWVSTQSINAVVANKLARDISIPVLWIAVIVAGTLIILRLLGREQGPSLLADTSPLTPVAGKTFRNQEVEIDGFSYRNCTFINVTFVLRGKKPFEFVHNRMEGFYLRLASPETERLVRFMHGALGLLKPVPFVDETGNTVDLPPPEADDADQENR